MGSSPLMQPATPIPPATVILEVASGQTTIIRGSIIIDSGGKAAIGGTNPLGIVGVAMQAQDSAAGYNMANSPSPITYRKNNITIAKAQVGQLFSARLVNTTTEATVAITDVGVEYGITKLSSGEWVVDKDKLGADARVIGRKADIERNRLIFEFLPTSIA